MTTRRPRLLDLFCGAGGAAMGYHRAGFDVVGVDIVPQPHYPFSFVGADAVEVLRWTGPFGEKWVDRFDAIHASPPCQAHTQMSNRWRSLPGSLAATRVDLLTPTLERLRTDFTMPWVVENVVGAAKVMRTTIKLHGGMFGLAVHRPRLFESNVLLMAPMAAQVRVPIGVYGKAPDGRRLWSGSTTESRAASSLEEAQDAMGMPWADWQGVKEAIPPAYTEWIGCQLLEYVEVAA